MQVIGPAAIYVAIVFAAGFALGVVRNLLLVPAVGHLAAVAIEMPAILLVSWRACRWTISRFDVSRTIPARLGMGLAAFLLLMSAEFGLTAAITHLAPASASACSDAARSIAACFVLGFAAPERLLGLAGQMLFALMPWIALHART